MSENLLMARRTKLNLHKKWLKNKTLEDHTAYTAARNQYNTLLRQHKQKYFADNFSKNIKNSKRTWELLKEAANLSKTN